LHFAFEDECNLYMAMEFVNGGDLYFNMQKEHRFEEPRARFYFAELTLALEYLH